MKYKRLSKLQLMIIAFVAVFTILSAFECTAVYYEYTINTMDVLAGEMRQENSINNCFPLMLIIGVTEVLLILKNTYMLQKINVILAIIRVFFTMGIFILRSLGAELFGIMGGLGKYVYVTTIVGYIVLALSGVLLLLHIILAVSMKRKRKSEI